MNIRSAEPADAGRLLEIYAYYVEHTAVTFEYDTPTKEEFEERITHTLEKYPFLVIEDGGEAVGYAYAGVFKDRAAYARSAEVSIYLDHGKRRRGYGSALYLALEEKLTEQGIKNVYACIASPPVEDEYLSRDSERFHGALGFVKCGEFHKCGYKFGRWYDMIWMEKLIGPHD
ncbi:MAG: N-acetyltransferase [Clostridia bacterium]|nr:N-acetyltransferase [Clostridia bacterium]